MCKWLVKYKIIYNQINCIVLILKSLLKKFLTYFRKYNWFLIYILLHLHYHVQLINFLHIKIVHKYQVVIFIKVNNFKLGFRMQLQIYYKIMK